MREPREKPTPPSIERTPNSSYDEQCFDDEVEESSQFNIRYLQKKLNEETDSKWRRIWEDALTIYDDSNWKEWAFIHEFTRLMPTGLDREEGVTDPQLLHDLDTIIREHYDYDKYVRLQNRRSELIRTERKTDLSSEGETELHKIEKELSQYDLKLLYIEMRKLGYSPKELRVAIGDNKK